MDFDELYSRLNPEQKSAVDMIEGPVQVIAGPGTGKTQVLAMRIANILRNTQINPNNILALTFTDSGVTAMRKRLKQIIGKAAYYVNIYTFHSFCSRIISEFPEKFVSAREMRAIEDLQKYEIIRGIIDKGNFKNLTSVSNQYFYIRDIIKSISDLKREYVSPDNFSEMIDSSLNELEALGLEETTYKYMQESKKILKWKDLLVIYREYQKFLAMQGFYDFEDMILFALEALKQDDELLYYYQEMFQYFLVDEYQDTNAAQNELVKTLASFHENPNLFVVGDDDQSIFRFQGASVENILLFKSWYPDSKNVVLKNNYRSSQLILDAANSLILNNTLRLDSNKQLTANMGYEDLPIEKYEFALQEQENYFLVSEIQKLVDNNGVDLEEIAIILRDNKDRDDILDFMVKAGIPYHIYGGGDILDDVWIRKIFSLMRVVVDPEDDFNVYDVLTLDCFDIPQEDIFKLSKQAHISKKKYYEIISSPEFSDFLSASGKDALVKFFDLMLHLQRIETNLSFKGFFEALLSETGLLEYILNRPDYVEILNKINSLFAFIRRQADLNPRLSLSDFLGMLDIMQDHKIKIDETEWLSSAKAVQILTGHKAKGLEFEYVFLPKCFDKKWGNKKDQSKLDLPEDVLKATRADKKEANEDERRLFYTALTRAKRKIYISFANTYQGSSSSKVVSQFVEEIDKQYVKECDYPVSDISELARLQFTEPDEIYFSENASEYIRQVLLGSFRMSATSLSMYNTCKRKFLYDQILKIPSKTPTILLQGSALHKALERLFIYFKQHGKAPELKWVIDIFDETLAKKDIPESEYKVARDKGAEILEGWYNYYIDDFKVPLFLEFDFRNKDLRWNDIPLTGSIDKIEVIDPISKTAKVVDYKSGTPKSRNDIMGLTKSSDGSVFRQLYFYKLLCDLDPTFQYLATCGEIDYLSSNDRGKYKKELFEFNEIELDKLKSLIADTYESMLNLEFDKTDDLDECADCPFRNVCKR